jgi:membrane protein implicated in regulation of membrane protease activity
MFDSASAELMWFLVGLVLLLSELMLPGFVIVFFGIGAWITAALIALGLLPTFNAQLLTFLVSSILALALFRRKGKQWYEGRVSGEMAPGSSMEDLRGQRAVVISAIIPRNPGGKVEFHGTAWNADADEPVQPGAVVEILERQNLLLRVKPIH